MELILLTIRFEDDDEFTANFLGEYCRLGTNCSHSWLACVGSGCYASLLFLIPQSQVFCDVETVIGK